MTWCRVRAQGRSAFPLVSSGPTGGCSRFCAHALFLQGVVGSCAGHTAAAGRRSKADATEESKIIIKTKRAGTEVGTLTLQSGYLKKRISCGQRAWGHSGRSTLRRNLIRVRAEFACTAGVSLPLTYLQNIGVSPALISARRLGLCTTVWLICPFTYGVLQCPPLRGLSPAQSSDEDRAGQVGGAGTTGSRVASPQR